jgi:hypothetical protein
MKKKISGGSGDPPRRVMEAAITMPLEIPEHLKPAEAREQLLDVLLMLALAGDVRAAKLYLDYSFKSNVEAKTGLSLEEALRIMQTSSNDLTAGDDDFE